MTSVFIATPAYGCSVTTAYVKSVMLMRVHLAKRKIPTQVFLLGNESLVCRARNICVAQFLRSPCTHLLFIDADISFDPQILDAMLQFDKDIVTAIYSKKNFDWDRFARVSADPACQEPVNQRALDFNINLLEDQKIVDRMFVKVHDAATGFMLIKRECIDRMQRCYPSLWAKNDIPGICKDIPTYCALFGVRIDPRDRRYLSEDWMFCRLWQLVGGEVWANIAAPICHTGCYILRPECSQLLRPLGQSS